MSSHRIATLIGGIIFLIMAGLALFRLLFGFGLVIGGITPGATSTFFAFVISAALALMLLRGGGGRVSN